MKRQEYILTLGSILGALNQVAPSAEAPSRILERGHFPIDVRYAQGEWDLAIDGAESGFGRLAPEETLIHLTEAAERAVPNSSMFSFLGAPGSPVWIAPHVEDPDVVLLGVSGTHIDAGVFSGDLLSLETRDVQGPGEFSVYSINSSGTAQIHVDTSDGIDANDRIPFGIGGHDHHNWAFTAPGFYDITFRASGQLTGGAQVESEEVVYQFAVGDVDIDSLGSPIAVDEGDADIAVIREGDDLALEVFWGANDDTAYAPTDAFYQVGPIHQIPVPQASEYAFLGQPGQTVWVAPQGEEPGKLFMALAADNLPEGFLENDLIQVALTSIEGPGAFSVYETDAFGTPMISMNSADGIDDQDVRDLIAGDHNHLNWAFTQPGTYQIGFQASGRRVADGQEIMSPETMFTFEVQSESASGLSIRRVSESSLRIEWTLRVSAPQLLEVADSLVNAPWTIHDAPIQTDGTTRFVEIEIDASSPMRFFRLVSSDLIQ